MIGETKGHWYLRQMLGSANFEAGPTLRFMSGNLCHQIEHHLYPDLPSNRLHEISVRVRQVCDKYDCLTPQALSWCSTARHGGRSPNCRCRTVPSRHRRQRAETRSESMFVELESGFAGTDPSTGRRRGLRTAIATVRGWRRSKWTAHNGRTSGRDDLAA